jgi:branched-chain amino acid transport system permease protein
MGTHRSGYYKISYGHDLALLDTPYRTLAVATLVATAALAPILVSDHVVYVLNLTLIAIMGALALNLLTGYAGQISLGHSAFLAVGAFTSHFLSSHGLPFMAVVPLAMAAGAILGIVVGAPALRLRGLYLVLATVGFHYIVAYLANNYQTSGPNMLQALTGLLLPAPDFGLFVLDQPRKWYYFLLVALALTTIFCINLVRTRVGRAWIAVRDRDITAAALGINVGYYKVLAFSVSSAFTCMAGAFLAYLVGSISAEYFTLTLAISYLAMVVLGGTGSIVGAYLGAIFVSMMPHVIAWLFFIIGAPPRITMLYVVPSQTVVFGLAMILFLIFEPRGLVGIWTRIRFYFELWPLRQSLLAERRK